MNSDNGSMPLETPWLVQQFFNNKDSLAQELENRFQNMPVLSVAKFRNVGGKAGRGVATLATQDNFAQLIIDVDKDNHTLHMAFTVASMLTLRFNLQGLSDMDRSRWIASMRRETDYPAFLWGTARWEYDYLIAVRRKYFARLYVFSPHNMEAAVHITPEIANQLLDWLETQWQLGQGDDGSSLLDSW